MDKYIIFILGILIGLFIGLSIYLYKLHLYIKLIEKAEKEMQEILCDKCKKLEVTLN